jgi:hypothetical protein
MINGQFILSLPCFLLRVLTLQFMCEQGIYIKHYLVLEEPLSKVSSVPSPTPECPGVARWPTIEILNEMIDPVHSLPSLVRKCMRMAPSWVRGLIGTNTNRRSRTTNVKLQLLDNNAKRTRGHWL